VKCAEKDYNNNLPGPQPPKKACQRYREYYKDIFPYLGKSKRVKSTSFDQPASLIFLVLMVERMTADDTLNPNRTWISKS